MECACEGSGKKWLGGGAVIIKSGLWSIPFDPPAHHLEETPGMNGINWLDKTYDCFKYIRCKRTDCGETDSEDPPKYNGHAWVSIGPNT